MTDTTTAGMLWAAFGSGLVHRPFTQRKPFCIGGLPYILVFEMKSE